MQKNVNTLAILLSITFILLSFADISTTVTALEHGGTEANLLMAYSFKTIGMLQTFILKTIITLIIAGAFVYATIKKAKNTEDGLRCLIILTVVVLLFSFVVTNNSLIPFTEDQQACSVKDDALDF